MPTKGELFYAELDEALRAGGIEHFTAREICRLDRQTSGVWMTPAPATLWPNAIETLRVLEWLRAGIGGKPIIISSGYRGPDYNRAVAGEPGSLHLRFSAFDFRVPGFSPLALARILVGHSEAGKLGIGCYPSFVHIDTRGSLGLTAPARWGAGPYAEWWK